MSESTQPLQPIAERERAALIEENQRLHKAIKYAIGNLWHNVDENIPEQKSATTDQTWLNQP